MEFFITRGKDGERFAIPQSKNLLQGMIKDIEQVEMEFYLFCC